MRSVLPSFLFFPFNLCLYLSPRLIATCSSFYKRFVNQVFLYSCHITRITVRITRWVPLVEQVLITLLEHPSLSFCLFRLAIPMFDLLWFTFLITPLVSLIYGFWLPLWYLRFTASVYPFGIFKLFLLKTKLVHIDTNIACVIALWWPISCFIHNIAITLKNWHKLRVNGILRTPLFVLL